MDVYHKVLYRLYEDTSGINSKSVNFINLVKDMGFYGNYRDIFDHLSQEGWIVETAKPDFVCISHWGVKEAKDSAAPPAPISDSEAKKECVRAVGIAKDFADSLEAFAQRADKKDFAIIEKKLKELQDAVAQLKKQF